jgi:hypothetical protein
MPHHQPPISGPDRSRASADLAAEAAADRQYCSGQSPGTLHPYRDQAAVAQSNVEQPPKETDQVIRSGRDTASQAKGLA